MMGQGLFEVKISEESRRRGAISKFMTRIRREGIVRNNKVYFDNYNLGSKTASDVAIAFSHIKHGYERFVFNQGWSESKYEKVIMYMIRNRIFLKVSAIEDSGKKYDKEVERLAKQNKLADEDELIKYVKQNGM